MIPDTMTTHRSRGEPPACEPESLASGPCLYVHASTKYGQLLHVGHEGYVAAGEGTRNPLPATPLSILLSDGAWQDLNRDSWMPSLLKHICCKSLYISHLVPHKGRIGRGWWILLAPPYIVVSITVT
jgi:hypothetical protein